MSESDAPLAPPVLLTQAHDGSNFDSGEPDLDEWLRRRASPNQLSMANRTYVVCPEGSARIVGYFALSMGQILNVEAAGSMRRNMPKVIPAVMLGRLATDRAWQGRGLGRAMLGDAVRRALHASEQAAARLLIVNPISPAAEAFYLRNGFLRLPVATPTLALDLMKLGTAARE